MKLCKIDYINYNSPLYNLIYQSFNTVFSNLQGITSVTSNLSKFNNQDVKLTLNVIPNSFLNTVSFNVSVPISSINYIGNGFILTSNIPVSDLVLNCNSSTGIMYIEFTTNNSSFGSNYVLSIYGSF